MAQEKNKKTTPDNKPERLQQPLAPAPGRVFAGVVLFCVVGLIGVSQLPHDWAAVSGCVVVLTIAAFVLDISGRKQAVREPHPLYVPGRLPMDSPKLRIGAIVVAVLALMAVFSISVQPTQQVSPLPFFLTAGFLFVVLPQALARRAVRLYDPDKKPSEKAGKRAKNR